MGIDFNTTFDEVVVPDIVPIQNIYDGGGLFASWVYVRTLTGTGIVAIKNSGVNFGWRLSVSDRHDGFDFNQGFSGASGARWESNSSAVPMNTWFHLALSYDSDSASNNPILSIDAQPITMTEAVSPVGTRSSDVGEPMILGNFGDIEPLDGILADLRLYGGGVVSPGRIQNLYMQRGGDVDIQGMRARYPFFINAYDLVRGNNGVQDLTTNSPDILNLGHVGSN